MFSGISSRQRAIGQALFVTFLWSTSWVIIKIGLEDIPPLVFAGLRYAAAALILLLIGWKSGRLSKARQLTHRQWRDLAVLGLLLYAITQGAQFAGLALLPAVAVSLLLNLVTVVVVFLGIVLLGEYPTGIQWAGTALYVVGIGMYFVPVTLQADQLAGLLIVIGGVIAGALATILGRHTNHSAQIDAYTVTTVSMSIGAVVLLGAGIVLEGIPPLSAGNWLAIMWLAVVNTAFAFTVWNVTLRSLTAMESSIINSTMLIQIGIMVWVMLGEALTLKEIAGMIIVAIAVLIVQLRRLPRRWRVRAAIDNP